MLIAPLLIHKPWREVKTIATLAGIGVVLALMLIYAGSCWWYPLGHCWCCNGKGVHSRKDGRVFRPCRWCKGSGRRWRVGRRIWNFFRRHVHT